jgi:hypothetical protein
MFYLGGIKKDIFPFYKCLNLKLYALGMRKILYRVTNSAMFLFIFLAALQNSGTSTL